MRTRVRLTIAGLVLGTALIGGVAWATMPRANTTIHGCYRSTGGENQGQLRVVDASADCRSSETAIEWNDQGAAGAPGATGPAGPAGPQGPKGDKGDAGTAGAGLQGVKGDSGPQGPKGDKGEAGDAGLQGPKGDACLPTNVACIGPPGPAGAGGLSTTLTTVEVPEAAGPRTVISTSPRYGRFEALCMLPGVETNTARFVRLYAYANSSDSSLSVLGLGFIAPGGQPNPFLLIEVDAGVPIGTVFTVLRFGTNADGTPSFSQEHVAIGLELLPSGSCRVTLAFTIDE